MFPAAPFYEVLPYNSVDHARKVCALQIFVNNLHGNNLSKLSIILRIANYINKKTNTRTLFTVQIRFPQSFILLGGL